MHPEELLEKFGARLHLLYGAAYGAIDTHDQNEASSIHAAPFMDRPLARAIHELCEDFGQVEEAVKTWFEQDAERWIVAQRRLDAMKGGAR
ncbi:hypothetical protein BH23GEM7_BH23GEM7_27230 [soil metagenome]